MVDEQSVTHFEIRDEELDVLKALNRGAVRYLAFLESQRSV